MFFLVHLHSLLYLQEIELHTTTDDLPCSTDIANITIAKSIVALIKNINASLEETFPITMIAIELAGKQVY